MGHRDVAMAGYGTSCPGETWREWIGVIAEGMAGKGEVRRVKSERGYENRMGRISRIG